MAGIKIIAQNKKARHEYHIEDTLEAGVVLVGTEIKSLRAGKLSLTDGWIDIDGGEAYLRDAHIAKYSHGNMFNHDERRTRKLLLHKKEIAKLAAKIHEKGMTVVPLKAYFRSQYVKVELGIGKGKKLYDKRESKKAKDAARDMERAIKGRR